MVSPGRVNHTLPDLDREILQEKEPDEEPRDPTPLTLFENNLATSRGKMLPPQRESAFNEVVQAISRLTAPPGERLFLGPNDNSPAEHRVALGSPDPSLIQAMRLAAMRRPQPAAAHRRNGVAQGYRTTMLRAQLGGGTLDIMVYRRHTPLGTTLAIREFPYASCGCSQCRLFGTEAGRNEILARMRGNRQPAL